jgi:hypothetical protein
MTESWKIKIIDIGIEIDLTEIVNLSSPKFCSVWQAAVTAQTLFENAKTIRVHHRSHQWRSQDYFQRDK